MKKEREKHIKMAKDWVEVYHREKYKTAIVYLDRNENGEIIVDKLFYQIVTKVNYLTACLWLEWRNKQVNDARKGFVQLPNKPNWLVMVRNFRRMQERKIKVLEYLKERQARGKRIENT